MVDDITIYNWYNQMIHGMIKAMFQTTKLSVAPGPWKSAPTSPDFVGAVPPQPLPPRDGKNPQLCWKIWWFNGHFMGFNWDLMVTEVAITLRPVSGWINFIGFESPTVRMLGAIQAESYGHGFETWNWKHPAADESGFADSSWLYFLAG